MTSASHFSHEYEDAEQVTFESVRRRAVAFGEDTPLGRKVNEFVDSARVNADDTCLVEKSAPAADWERIACDTLISLLAHCNDSTVRDWFSEAGVEA